MLISTLVNKLGNFFINKYGSLSCCEKSLHANVQCLLRYNELIVRNHISRKTTPHPTLSYLISVPQHYMSIQKHSENILSPNL
jgi:hypothetical protein